MEMGQGSLALLDYRRQVAAHYAEVRHGRGSPEERWRHWRSQRDQLFREHPLSALTEADRKNFAGLHYYSYNPALRFELELAPAAASKGLRVDLAQDGQLHMRDLGILRFSLGGERVSLTAYWLEGYGGGLFLPFRDGTNGEGTYGGGRYLLDTIKGADLGGVGGKLILDFNYAYNPSCAYNPRWHCPLAPVDNWLEVPIQAGEKAFEKAQVAEPDPSAVPRAS
jgi:uncharacterized protein (DUF1684 family)